jgi:hypothetical protein
LSHDDLLLAIDRTRVEIEVQKQIAAGLVAAPVESRDEASHRQLVDMHLLMRAILESDLMKMEAEWQRRQ